MKKILLSLLCVSFLFSSCVDENKNNETTKNTSEKTKVCYYSLDQKSSKLNWTAFKTSEKVAVGGVFDKFDIRTEDKAADIKTLLESTKFAIESSSINSGNEERDVKLVNFFFGNTEDNGIMKGQVKHIEDKNIYFSLTFNRQNIAVPFQYEIKGETLLIKGKINLNDFHADKALSSLNEACEDLHKGADGISKTWPDVDIVFESKITEICK